MVGAEAFPIISVRDLPAVRAFYERLGFAQTYQFPSEGDAVFVTLQRGASAIGIGIAEAGEPPFAYWVYVEDVDRTVMLLQAAGTVVVSDPSDQAWGERTATVLDPAGNLVHVGSTGSRVRHEDPPTHGVGIDDGNREGQDSESTG